MAEVGTAVVKVKADTSEFEEQFAQIGRVRPPLTERVRDLAIALAACAYVVNLFV